MSDYIALILLVAVAALGYTCWRLKKALDTLRVEAARAAKSKTPDHRLEQALADGAYDALLVVDEKCQVVAINRSAETLFGRSHPVGQSLAAVAHTPELESLVTEVLANREESLEEQLTFGKCPYRVRVYTWESDGRRYISLALQDVSELVRLNRARRDMVANISHELRKPIANMRIIIEGLFREQEKPKGKESRSALKAIARETDSLLRLAQELLDLSMIESGQAILRMVDTPLKALAEEAVAQIADQSDAKDLKIVYHVPETMQVLADRDQARRVLLNLIHNAIKWSPSSGKITVRAISQGDEAIISVQDEGPGVPEDHRERIFERFYQVDASRSGGEGTGLGLAICKHIVEAHGGRIWVESNSQGRGGRFFFTLPLAEEKTPSKLA